ncbi:MAG: PQQ-binding-like beta-propeller repeat protein [Cyclobacteriaceae bacterium]
MKSFSSHLILLFALVLHACDSHEEDKGQYSKWGVYRGTKDANQYSSLTQINKENVKNLKLAWTYRTGGNTERSTIQCNPIIIEKTAYLTSPDLQLMAVNATNGTEIWRFNSGQLNSQGNVNRGVVYWSKGVDERILFTAGHYLYALDAKTGQKVKTFGEDGQVDMRKDMDVPFETVNICSTSPGIIFGDLLIMGSSVLEGHNSVPGHIRAYNALTGDREWIFHTYPQGDEYGADTWEVSETANIGGVNAWGGLSLDEDRNLIFAATGSPTYDFYGGERLGENLFGNCVIALNATTGERVWHYQIIHHDLWDYDLPCAPNLVTINVNGLSIDAVAQPTKTGFIFLLDRETGEPLYPIEEREVLPSDIPRESAYPTQPFPSFPVPFTKQGFAEEDLSNIGEEAYEFAIGEFNKFKSGKLFTPPSFEGTLVRPGTRGGAEWSGASFDPCTGVLYITANEFASIIKIKAVEFEVERAEEAGGSVLASMALGRKLYKSNCISCHGIDKKGNGTNYPSLVGIESKYTIDQISDLLTRGRRGMPAFTWFDNTQLQAIGEFLTSDEDESGAATKGNSITRYVNEKYRYFFDTAGYPASKPPWGTLNAIDLNSGKMLWKIPLGEYPELTAKGIPTTGTQLWGGCVTTAGGLVFVGASRDEKFHAFDKATGELLWEVALPAVGYATPSIYQIDGKQYVLIAAGGGGKNGTRSGDYYMAYALPD